MTIDQSGSLLSLEEFRDVLGYNPWHFWGLANAVVPVTSNCNDVVKQYAWQDADACGRADILTAIQTAEAKLQAYLGFAVAPKWEADELPFPVYNDRRSTYLSSADAVGRWLNVRLRNGKVQNIGTQARTLIGNAAVTLSDADGDQLDETFTLTIATTVTDASQIAAYFTSADRFDGSAVSECFRVRPISVTIAGGTATITGKTWNIVRPVLYEGAATTTLDPDTAGNFASSLAVYRLYTDTTDQGAFLWETIGGNACASDATGSGSALDPSAIATQSARYVVRDAETGVVAGEAATYDTDASEYVATGWNVGYAPERAQVNYLAGWPLEGGRMASRMRAIVARMAAAELSRPICACDKANRELYRWQFDRSRAAGANDEQYTIAPEDLSNPFGPNGGHIWAWREVRREALAGAVLA